MSAEAIEPDSAESPGTTAMMNTITQITTFGPEPYSAKPPIPVAIRRADDGFLAGFFDANIHTSGETEQEAFDNLRSLILDYYEALEHEKPELLGPEPTRQLAILRDFIRKQDGTYPK